MPLPLLLIGAGIMAAAGAAKAYSGARQARNGRLLAANNVRPDYNIQKEYYDNQSLAANMAQSGLSEDALNYYTTNAERGLSASLDGVLQAGGNVNSISSAVDNYNRSLAQVAATDSEMKNNNIRYLIDRNKELAGQKTMQWSLNKYEPYKDTAATAAALQKTGTENMYNGISQVGSALVAGSSAFNYAKPGGGGGDTGGDGGGSGDRNESGGDTAMNNGSSFYSYKSQPGDLVMNNPNQSPLQSLYSSSTAGGYGSVDDIMAEYANSPYKDLIRRRLIGATA